jgi:hypothetical protein
MAAFTALTTVSLPDAFVGVAYEAAVAVNGSTAAELTLEAGTTQTGKQALPAGLAYGTDGRITGTPTGDPDTATGGGVYNLSVKVTDGTNTKDNAALTLNVHPYPVADTGGYATEQADPARSLANDLSRMWTS